MATARAAVGVPSFLRMFDVRPGGMRNNAERLCDLAAGESFREKRQHV